MAVNVVAVVLSGLFAGLVAVLATVAVEKLGGRLGGVLASMPTTIVPACIGLFEQFHAGSGSDQAASLRMATFAVPVGMLVDGGFLLVWRHLPQRLPSSWSLGRRLCAVSTISIAMWLVLASLVLAVDTLVLARSGLVAVGIAAVAALVFNASAGLAACLTAPEAPPGSNPVSWGVLLVRGALCATAMWIAIAISSVSSIAGGLMSTFPAIFCTTMVGTWLSQGEAVPIGAVGPMILGSTSVSVFALLFGLLAPLVGVSWGTALLCWPLAAGCVSVPTFCFLQWRLRSAGYGSLGARAGKADPLDDVFGDEALNEFGELERRRASMAHLDEEQLGSDGGLELAPPVSQPQPRAAVTRHTHER